MMAAVTSNADTIFAPATGPGRAAIAVIRISGSGVGEALRRLTGRTAWVDRRATRVMVRGADGEAVDDALAIWFRGPASATGEDVAELHLHGGTAVVDGALRALAAIDGLRPAEPGEFSRRAFERGKLDLTQAEAVADLIAAETEAQRRQALRQLDGALGRLYDGWRSRLLRAMAHLEAAIDFSDDGVPADLVSLVIAELAEVQAAMRRHLDDGRQGEALRRGFAVVLAGAPNAGKSSLLNRLSGRAAAIVDAAPGTTRDVVAVVTEMGGLPVTLQDTAGLREAVGGVEREGVRRARACIDDADLVLAVFDVARRPALCGETKALLTGPLADKVLAVFNKCDLAVPVAGAGGPGAAPSAADGCGVAVSALTGAGIDGLREAIAGRLRREPAPDGGPALTRLRHRHAVEVAVAALQRLPAAHGEETLAEELRTAVAAIGRITGAVDVEEVLGAIFAEFCIGK